MQYKSLNDYLKQVILEDPIDFFYSSEIFEEFKLNLFHQKEKA